MSNMYVLYHDSWEENAVVFNDLKSLKEFIRDAAIEDQEEAMEIKIYAVDRTCFHRPNIKFEVSVDV
jgi:hypothetical protein